MKHFLPWLMIFCLACAMGCSDDEAEPEAKMEIAVSGSDGFEIHVTTDGSTEVWEGEINYSGTAQMMNGTYFRQLQFFPDHSEDPTMYLNFTFPQGEKLEGGWYDIQPVSMEESGGLAKPVAKFYFPFATDRFPDPAESGYTEIQLDDDDYAIIGDLSTEVVDENGVEYQIEGRYWLDEMND